MNQIGELLSQYATKEVLTVIGAVFTAWMGWKTAKGSYGVATKLAKRASFLGLTAAGLLAMGLGTVGLGIGEIKSRPTDVSGFSNRDLVKILESGKASESLVKEVLTYVQARDRNNNNEKPTDINQLNSRSAYQLEDGKLIPVSLENGKLVPVDSLLKVPYEEITIDPVKENSVKSEESIVSIPTAWGLIGLGFASSLAGLSVFFTRHNRRNIDDPNHPQFDSQYVNGKNPTTQSKV
jgi:hypothetical protein